MSAVKWAEQPCLAFDVETTGVSVWEDRIVTAALVEIRPDQHPQADGWLVNPGVEIPEGATAIHGVTNEHAQANGLPPAEVLEVITTTLASWMSEGLPVVAMNAAYDLTMLEVENRRHGIRPLTARLGRWGIQPIIDPFVMDKYAHQFRKGGRKLTDLCTLYGVPLGDDAHDAGADALAAGLLWRKVIEKYPAKFRGLDLAGLHKAQIGWRAEQQDSLREYFDRQGKEHDGCDGSWPLLMPPAGVELPRVAS